jgi:multidrug resistance protein, MATE family
MDSRTQSAGTAAHLPAQRIDAGGRAHVDQRAVFALALPLMANSAVQIVLNLTDMWFMGRISTKALAAVGAVQWLIVAAVLVLGGAGMAVQTLVAQSFGARRYRRASQAVWTALWAMACAAPLFVLVGAARHLILAPFGFDPEIEHLAAAFWFPRMGGAFVAAAVWATFGFFNGVGRPRVTLAITAVTTVTNALLNQLFIFGLGWGIAGSAWATNVAQLLGLVFAVALFLRADCRRRYHSHLTWHPHARRLLQQLKLGVPMGLSPASDLIAFAMFQMMQTRLGTAGGGGATQMVVLTALLSASCLFQTDMMPMPASRFLCEHLLRKVLFWACTSRIHAQVPAITAGQLAKALRQHIPRGIDVTVVQRAAFRAPPLPLIEPQLIERVPALRAGLARGIPAIHAL